MKRLSIISILLTCMLMLNANTYYVSKSTGSNRNAGTKEAPLKNLQKAIDIAQDGDKIFVAEGNYFGTLDCGTIDITKPLQIYGGYSVDFTERDVLRHLTLIQPTVATLGTMRNAVVNIDIKQESNLELVFDGFCIDRGNTCAYSAKGEGKVPGVLSPRLMQTGRGVGGDDLKTPEVSTPQVPLMRLNVMCFATIRNCAFLNGSNYAILGSGGVKNIKIENNLFVNNCFAACQIAGTLVKGNVDIEFAYNTVLFSWSREKDLGELGYGYRYMSKANSYVHHNIIGCSTFAALDRTYQDNKAAEAIKTTTAEYNLFFLNRQADLTLPGAGQFLRVWAKDFEDVELLKEVSGNQTVTDPKIFGGKINDAYLKGFINLTYNAKFEYNAYSGMNQFREALGLNKQAKQTSVVSMYANRYPFMEALALFGAVEGYGAQLPTQP